MLSNDFRADYFRYTGSYRISIRERRRSPALRYLMCMRGGALLKHIFWHMSRKYGLELGDGSNVSPGVYLGHAYSITVNPRAIIGPNCSLHKGCTIGQENRGDRKGAPHLMSRVWVGSNATVVGKIVIGEDVLIAPGAYVNVNVPAHSIVIGNPCVIKHCDNATEGYIANAI